MDLRITPASPFALVEPLSQSGWDWVVSNLWTEHTRFFGRGVLVRMDFVVALRDVAEGCGLSVGGGTKETACRLNNLLDR